MKLWRIRRVLPWRTALVLAFGICLPTLTFRAWILRELPPLQRYYLRSYWESSETADKPGVMVQVQWLELTAPGRESRWPTDSDVTDDPAGKSPFVLSSSALTEGWTAVERSPPEPVNSVVLDDVLRTDFYDGQSFLQTVWEPTFYGLAALLFVLLVAWLIRDDIGPEYRDVWRVVRGPESLSVSGWKWPSDAPPDSCPD